jgi:hypothetical protein
MLDQLQLETLAAGFKRVTPKVTDRPAIRRAIRSNSTSMAISTAYGQVGGLRPNATATSRSSGYLNRIRSSRRLEAECHRNIEVIWPDFKTIADFRSDNRAAFRAVFRQFTLLCRELNLFGRELLAVDGTRIKAINNKDRNFTKNLLEKFIKAVDSVWTNICGGSTRAMPRKPRPMARAPKTSRKRSRRGARSAGDTGCC